MKGRIHSISMTGAILGLLAAFTCAYPVRAQDVVQGTFVLPFEVQWVGKTLVPGEYHFRLTSTALGGVIKIRDAQDRTKLMLVTGLRDDFSGPSTLAIVERNGKRYVASLALKQIGAKLRYPVPTQKTDAAELTEASVQVIPVRIAGN
jgi:hypothetical protein